MNRRYGGLGKNHRQRHARDRKDPFASSGQEEFGDLKVGKAKASLRDYDQPPAAKAGIVPKLCFRWIFSGPTKSGKTNLARWVLDKFYTKGKKSFFDEVWLLSPTAKIDPTWLGLAGLEPKRRIADPKKFAPTLQKILRDQKRAIAGVGDESRYVPSESRLNRTRKKAKSVLIITDDAITEKIMTDPDYLKVYVQGRHYKMNVMAMTQSYMKIPRSIRLQASNIAFFPSKSTEIDRLYTEHGPREITKKQFHEIVEYATEPTPEDKWPFLMVNCNEPINERFRRNLDERIIPNSAKSAESRNQGIKDSRPRINQNSSDNGSTTPRRY